MTQDRTRAGLHPQPDVDAPSVFLPENLLREARRQKSIPPGRIPPVCVLDPDGDVVRYLKATGAARKSRFWACYHSDMYDFTVGGETLGIVGCAVGAPYAVLVAEQMFASGCELLVSITSAGQITPRGRPPYFVLIERALRDEGTSIHYTPQAEFSVASPEMVAWAQAATAETGLPVHVGATWTTDAPFRETESAVDHASRLGILGVEMEASALYALAVAKGYAIVCFAHITNQMARIEGDFEKGESGGSRDALTLIAALAGSRQRGPRPRT